MTRSQVTERTLLILLLDTDDTDEQRNIDQAEDTWMSAWSLVDGPQSIENGASTLM